jgi:hypothetical protein
MNRRDALRSLAILPAIAAGCAASPLVGYKLDSKTGVRPVYAHDRLLADVEELANGLERELWDRFPQASCWQVEVKPRLQEHRNVVDVFITGYLSTGDEFRCSFGFDVRDPAVKRGLARLFRGHKWHVMLDIENKIHGHPLA